MRHLLIRDDEHAHAEVDFDLSIFKLTWRGYVPSEAFRRILIQGHMQVQQHKLRFWLSDSRSMAAILLQDEDWVKRDWIPRIFQTGLERLAIIPSKDYFYQGTANRIVDAAQPRSPFPLQFFEEPELAMRWLLASKSAVA